MPSKDNMTPHESLRLLALCTCLHLCVFIYIYAYIYIYVSATSGLQCLGYICIYMYICICIGTYIWWVVRIAILFVSGPFYVAASTIQGAQEGTASIISLPTYIIHAYYVCRHVFIHMYMYIYIYVYIHIY